MCGVESLPDFISRELRARGDSVTAFADRIGVSRQTVARWDTSLPAADTLRRVAADLEVPYSQVLSAALASAGYIDSLSDMLAGQPLRVVTTCEGPYMERGEVTVAGVFTDPTRAEEYAEISSATSYDTDVEETTVRVDAAELPDVMRIYTTTWWSRTDQISQTTSICLADERPTRVTGRDVSDVEASELSDLGQVFALRVDSLTGDAGRAQLMSALNELRKAGKLLPPEADPYAGWSGLAASSLSFMLPLVKAAEAADDTAGYSAPSGESHGTDRDPADSTPGTEGFNAFSSGLSSAFTGFSGTTAARSEQSDATGRRLAPSMSDRPYSWNQHQPQQAAPKIRRFVVELPAPSTAD